MAQGELPRTGSWRVRRANQPPAATAHTDHPQESTVEIDAPLNGPAASMSGIIVRAAQTLT